MIVWILALVVLLLVFGFLFLARNVMRLDTKREVLHLYENVDWNTDAVEFVRKEMRNFKFSLLSWVAGFLLLQTVVIFLAIIYVLENVGTR